MRRITCRMIHLSLSNAVLIRHLLLFSAMCLLNCKSTKENTTQSFYRYIPVSKDVVLFANLKGDNGFSQRGVGVNSAGTIITGNANYRLNSDPHSPDPRGNIRRKAILLSRSIRPPPPYRIHRGICRIDLHGDPSLGRM